MLESMPELYNALKLKKENPPRFQNEDTIEYNEETPPRFQKEDTTYFQKEDSIQQKEENAPQSNKEKRNQILNSVLLVIVLIAGLCLTAFAFFEYDENFDIGIGWFIIVGYVSIGIFGFFLAEKLRLEKSYLYFIYILLGIFFVGGIILTVGSFFDWGSYLWNILPFFITTNLAILWTILVLTAFCGSFMFAEHQYEELHPNLPKSILGLKILFFIGGCILIILNWVYYNGEISRNSMFVFFWESSWVAIVIFILVLFIFAFFKFLLEETNDLLNKNLAKTKWFLLTGCLILGLTAGYIQIKNVKLKAENLQLEKKLSKNTPTWSYNREVTLPNIRFIDIKFRHDKTKKLIINGIDIDNFSNVDNKVRTGIRSNTTINSVKIIDTNNVTHNIRQR